MRKTTRICITPSTLEDTQVHCPGDGNDDGRGSDRHRQLPRDHRHWNGSSVYDINLDGITDATDLQLIQDNLGAVCHADALNRLKATSSLRAAGAG